MQAPGEEGVASSTAPAARPSLTGGVAAAPRVFILDLGSRTIKSGVHTATTPHLTPSRVGVPRYPRSCGGGLCPALTSPPPGNPGGSSISSRPSLIVGHEAVAHRGLLRLSRPVQHGGAVVDWAGVAPLVQQSIHTALPPPAPAPGAATDLIYSLVERPFASRPQRARLAAQLFEGGCSGHEASPRATGVFCGVGPLLALYATGQTSGLVLDIGDGAVSTAAAVDGYVVTPCLQHEPDGATGAAVTAHLTRLLYQSGTLGPAAAVAAAAAAHPAPPPSLTNSVPRNISGGAGAGTEQERDVVYDIKEACCSVAATPLVTAMPQFANVSGAAAGSPCIGELNAALIAAARHAQQRQRQSSEGGAGARLFTLPDGGAVQVGAVEAEQASEVLFYPALMGSEGRGVVDIALDAVAAAPAELRQRLLVNVVLTGGVTCTAGFGKRFFRELQSRAGGEGGDAPSRICVTAPEQRAYAAWMGASYVAQLSTFVSNMVVSRAAYEEEGEAALARKVLT